MPDTHTAGVPDKSPSDVTWRDSLVVDPSAVNEVGNGTDSNGYIEHRRAEICHTGPETGVGREGDWEDRRGGGGEERERREGGKVEKGEEIGQKRARIR